MNNKEKAQWLSDRWAEVAQGGVWEECDHGWFEAPEGPRSEDTMLHTWRVVMPPVKKVIDLSCLVNGVDCEFWNSSQRHFGNLDEVSYDCGELQFIGCGESWDFCQPRMNHWHNWQGGECPVPEGYVVEVLFRGGHFSAEDPCATDWNWKHDSYSSDIIAFRVLRVAENYCMPWEAES